MSAALQRGDRIDVLAGMAINYGLSQQQLRSRLAGQWADRLGATPRPALPIPDGLPDPR